ncbi:MAG: sulfite exporter TauE/SafE family protein [Betaproteobacteria bacterium]|nr:MAG: sulfite exporter TauE/SafE family protein [Betaproteobacteria bacterium]
MEWWIAYLLLGLFVGLFAGMLGIGGGMLLVPLLVFMFSAQDFPADRTLHLAIGTSLTTIVFTSLSSIRAHHMRRAVRWDIVRRAAAGLVIGTILGAFLADWLDARLLAIVFVIFVSYSATQMLLDVKPKPTRRLPGPAGMAAGSGVVGVISSLVGAGGGVVSIPLMVMCNVEMRNAVGTSAALGFPIALAGALAYAYTGLGEPNLPPMGLGYVYLPALISIVIGTFVTVPIGAHLAHSMPVVRLKKIFAVILFLLAARMLWSIFSG